MIVWMRLVRVITAHAAVALAGATHVGTAAAETRTRWCQPRQAVAPNRDGSAIRHIPPAELEQFVVILTERPDRTTARIRTRSSEAILECWFPSAGFGEQHTACSNSTQSFKINRPDGVFTYLDDGALFMDGAPPEVRQVMRPFYATGVCR